jgi:hypothetical protein
MTMAVTTIEDRLSNLELEVAQLKARFGEVSHGVNWVDAIAGSMADEPDFEEVLKLGRLARASIGNTEEGLTEPA